MVVTSHSVVIGTERVPVRIVRTKRARSMNLSLMHNQRALRLTLPQRTALQEGMAFVNSQSRVVARWLVQVPSPVLLTAGAEIMWRGLACTIIHDSSLGRTVLHTEGKISLGGPIELLATRLRRWILQEAKADLTRRATDVANTNNLTIKQLRFGDPRSRWGSCSSDGRISLSWRLIMAPDDVRHYVVVHELAHLTHMNHSPAFWQEVTRLGGDIRHRHWLKHNGMRLHGFIV